MVDYISKPNEARSAKTVVVIYEDSALRERAMQFCERLASDTPGIDMDWWSFQLLGHPTMAQTAVERAAGAEVVVFALGARGDLPDEIKLWIEKWLNKRGEREGALVGLLRQEEGMHGVASFREIYLRHIARRGGMDYLSHVAPTILHAIPDSLDSYNERAGRMTSVLDSILQKRPPMPPHL
ncbi:MAG TPA: hypothetical protein VHH73_08475 [Verrucomicrobiae bacterium]|nr:hypothetical protein [Verrucomicrobiae bacterium]